MNFQIETKAYKKLMLHSIKYHKSDCLGLLLGHKVEGSGQRTVIIEDAIPLFHNRVMAGTLEVAFDMVESTMVTDSCKIVGIYEAPITGADTQQTPSPLAVAIATQIKSGSHFNEPCVISIKAVTQRQGLGKDESTYLKLDVDMYAMSSGGPQSLTLVKQSLEAPDYRTVAGHIKDKSYLSLVDFDDHFDNAENDWRNLTIFD